MCKLFSAVYLPGVQVETDEPTEAVVHELVVLRGDPLRPEPGERGARAVALLGPEHLEVQRQLQPAGDPGRQRVLSLTANSYSCFITFAGSWHSLNLHLTYLILLVRL